MTSSGGLGAQPAAVEQSPQSAAEPGPIYEPTPDTGNRTKHSPEAFLGAMAGAVVLSNAGHWIDIAGKVGSNIVAQAGNAAAVETGAAALATGVSGGANVIGTGIETALSATGLNVGLKSLEAGASAVLSALATTGKLAVEGAISIATNPMVLTTLALYGAYVYRDKLAALAKKVVKFPKEMRAKMINSEVGKNATGSRFNIPSANMPTLVPAT